MRKVIRSKVRSSITEQREAQPSIDLALVISDVKTGENVGQQGYSSDQFNGLPMG